MNATTHFIVSCANATHITKDTHLNTIHIPHHLDVKIVAHIFLSSMEKIIIETITFTLLRKHWCSFSFVYFKQSWFILNGKLCIGLRVVLHYIHSPNYNWKSLLHGPKKWFLKENYNTNPKMGRKKNCMLWDLESPKCKSQVVLHFKVLNGFQM